MDRPTSVAPNPREKKDDLVPRSFLLHILLLWLVGNALRLTILAVPPVIPSIHDDLHLSATGVGILGGLPVLLFAVAALPGSLLIARLGPVRALVAGLVLTAAAGALRGAVPAAAWLYAMTILMGAGVAVMQPAMPVLVRRWTPDRIGFATAVYSNGLLVGEVVPVLTTIPLVLPWLGGSWQLDLAFWSLPVAAIAALVVAATRSEGSGPVGDFEQPRWRPDWSDGLVWRLGFTFGSANAVYFAANTFLPDYLLSRGRPDLISATLSALNFGQLPASILLLAVAGRLEGRSWPYAAFGAVSLVSLIGVATTASLWTVAWAGVLGFAGAGVLVLVLALPPLLAAPADVAPVSAAMLTVSYAFAMVVAVVSGAAWDATGIAAAAFVPMGLCALVLITLPATMPVKRRGVSA
jgi:MFS transporter, CP family, cyanate transporter